MWSCYPTAISSSNSRCTTSTYKSRHSRYPTKSSSNSSSRCPTIYRGIRRILTMLGMLSDQRTSHSNFMILQHQYLVNRIKDWKKVMEMNQSVKYLVASSQGHLKMNKVTLSELRKRRRKKEKMNLVSFQKHLTLSKSQNHMYSI